MPLRHDLDDASVLLVLRKLQKDVSKDLLSESEEVGGSCDANLMLE